MIDRDTMRQAGPFAYRPGTSEEDLQYRGRGLCSVHLGGDEGFAAATAWDVLWLPLSATLESAAEPGKIG